MMNSYVRIMQFFWLAAGISIIVGVTILGFMQGFDRWFPYYIFGLMALFLYFIRRFMLKRLRRLQEEHNKEENK